MGLIVAKVREIKSKDITDAVAQLCQRANFELDEDVLAALKHAQQSEQSPLGKEILHQLVENARVAEAKNLPLCQDCGKKMKLELQPAGLVFKGEGWSK